MNHNKIVLFVPLNEKFYIHYAYFSQTIINSAGFRVSRAQSTLSRRYFSASPGTYRGETDTIKLEDMIIAQ